MPIRWNFLLRLTILFLIPLAGVASPAQTAEVPALINVKDLAPGIIVEMRYATTNNFTGKKLYPLADECLLCEPAAHRLASVQNKLERRGYGLKVWDCYRPISVQKKLWDIVPDPRYVADPKTGSRHNRGASIDLTLVDKSGRELPMPTGFDEFSERAHRSYSDLPQNVIRNRAMLEEVMGSEGFVGLATEWWHFDDPLWSQFALRNEPLGSASLKKDRPATRPNLVVPIDTQQMITVTSRDWNAGNGQLQRWSNNGAHWARVGEPWAVSLGKKGMAWGRGIHPIQTHGPMKKEGDLTTPAGVFKIGKAYGYADQAQANSKWPYQHVNDGWVCVDDPASKKYNDIFDASQVKNKDWSSAEKMKRSDNQYKWLINIEQNTPVACGCGSCIFLHIWRSEGSGTAGCTAMDENDILVLLSWLDPAKHPVIIQLPEETYTQFKSEWGLP